MAVEISVDHPHFPKDTEFEVGGVLVKNGSTVKLDEDQERDFVSRNRKAVKDYASGSSFIKVAGTAKFGPSVVEKEYATPETTEGSDK